MEMLLAMVSAFQLSGRLDRERRELFLVEHIFLRNFELEYGIGNPYLKEHREAI